MLPDLRLLLLGLRALLLDLRSFLLDLRLGFLDVRSTPGDLRSVVILRGAQDDGEASHGNSAVIQGRGSNEGID
jgi:hypothetical protein